MKLSNFRIKDKLTAKIRLEPFSTPKDDKNQDNCPTSITEEKFNNFLNSFQNLIKSLTNNNSKQEIQAKNKSQSSRPRVKKDLDFRDRYVLVDLPQFQDGKIDCQKLETWIGEVCQETLSVAFHYFTEKKINYEQMKIFASQSMLRNLTILVDTYEITADEIKFIDKSMEQSVFPYLKAKYPLTVENDVNKALQSVIEEIDNYQILANDYFFSSEINFEHRQSGRYDDLIMRFINEILIKIDTKVSLDQTSELTLFKEFENNMTDIFQKSFEEQWINSKNTMKESKNLASEKEKEKYRKSVQEYTHYSISRKVSQNTQLYSEHEIKSGYLSIKSSAILRILTKWCEELWQKFQNQNYYRDRTDGLGLIANKKTGLVFPWLKSLLTENIKLEKKNILSFLKQIEDINYAQQIQLLRNQLENPGDTYIEKYEKVTGKFACKIVNNIQNFIVVYLNRLIHGLVSVSMKCFRQMKQFTEYWPTPYNLLSFKIGDLVRCKYSSKEKEVLKIFKEIQSRSKQDEDKFKIIRIKNRLKKGTNDILINAKLNNSITCQIQLAVNSATSDFIICSNNINHYIYELERSRFGPISEICSIWKNFDKRSKQFDKLIEKQKPQKQKKIFEESPCIKQNKQHELFEEKNPFICSECNKHIYNTNYIVSHVKCKNCKYFKCAMCLIEENIKTENKDFFLKQDSNKEECRFWKTENMVPSSGKCIFIKNARLEVIAFKKIEHNFKHNLVSRLNDEIVIMREVSSLKDLNKFLTACVVFEVPQQFIDKQLGLQSGNSNQNLIVELFIPQYIKNCLKQQKQTISILRQDHLTKVNFDKIIGQYRQKFKSIKSIQYSSTYLRNLDLIFPQFVNLKRLNINLNQVIDVSPITQFKKLQKLYMNENQIKNLPQQIGNLQQLKELDAYNNQIVQIPQSIVRMKSLSILNLSQNQIKMIPENIFQLENLKHLLMRKNQIQQFPHGLGKHKKLQVINLQSNKIQKMPQQFEDLSNLHQLILSSNSIKQLPNKIDKMNKLTIFQASFNQINKISLAICNITSLQNLALATNTIEQLPDELSNLQKLKKLSLSRNKLINFNPCVFKLSKLTHIHIDNNKIEELPDQFSSLKELKHLNIEGNLIKKFPLTAIKLNLTQFYYSLNKFQNLPFDLIQRKNDCLSMIPNQNQKIKKINCQEIPTYQKQIKVIRFQKLGLEQFPQFAFKFENLQNLVLIENNFKLIPDLFHSEMKLKEINLSFNKITTLPITLSTVKTLTNLYLQGNQLSEISSDFSQLSQLQFLDLSKNKFKLIPEVLQTMQNISEIILDSNSLQTLPDWIGNLNRLFILSAENNKITMIPLSICKNQKINRLNLKGNSIEVIPQEIGQMTSLGRGQLWLYQNPMKQIKNKDFVLKMCDYLTRNWINSLIGI